MPDVTTGSSNVTLEFDEAGERVYSCRCGETHRGDYAEYDFGHHNCLHDCRLIWIEDIGDVMCPMCGKSWDARNL